MFGLIKKILIGLLTGIVDAYNHTKWVSLSNQKCMIQPIFTGLHPIEYSQEFHYYPFAIKLDKCVGSCNTLNDLSMSSNQNRKLKCNCVQHDYRNKWVENINKGYILWM